MKLSKKLCITAKKSFSLVLALTLMLSICAVSGMSLNVFAATSLDQKIYINLNKNKEWNGFSSVTYRFAKDDGTVLKTDTVSKILREFLKPLHHPVQQELSFLPGLILLFPKRLLQKIPAVSILRTAIIPIMRLMHILG